MNPFINLFASLNKQADKESTFLDCLRFLEKQRFGIELQGAVLFMKQQGHMDSFAYKRLGPGFFSLM